MILEFEYEGMSVIGCSATKQKEKSVTLEFFIQDDHQRWGVLTEHTVRETDASFRGRCGWTMIPLSMHHFSCRASRILLPSSVPVTGNEFWQRSGIGEFGRSIAPGLLIEEKCGTRICATWMID